jgi:hypothetical protein
MTLGLITPVGSNFVKDWVAQNDVNCELIDDFTGAQASLASPLGTYTPVLTAVTTPPTLGTGSASVGGFYYKIFDQIYCWGFIRFGTGLTAGSGVYSITLPFKAKSLIPASATLGAGPVIGNGYVWDDSAAAGRQAVSCQLRTNQSIMFGLRMNSGAAAREVTHLAPITWAVDDGIKWAVRYQRDTT